MLNSRFISFCLAFTTVGCLTSCGRPAQHKERAADSVAEVKVVRIKAMYLHRILEIPGELRAFQDVVIKAKMPGYISWIGVDRGSELKRNDKMLTIFDPELDERVREEESKYSSALSSLAKSQAALSSTKSRLLEASARYDADTLTLDRLNKTEIKMSGAVALNDIDVQTKTVESDKARVESMNSEVQSGAAVLAAEKSNVAAAANVVKAVRAMRSYLTINAPFNGVITERDVHVGSMVGPAEYRESALLRIQQRNILRLVVAVPEDSVAGLKQGQRVSFRVPAFLGQDFYGIVARPAYALDVATRTMPVELSVDNHDGRLEPGMFATAQWPVSRLTKTLFVPSTAVSTDLKGTFVNLIKGGVAQRLEVQKGQPMGDFVEVVGHINDGDEVALTATDELKSGTHLISKLVDPAKDIN